MRIPDPKVGLVINYSYLWNREAAKGRDEGRKYRPCAIVIAVHGKTVAVAPVTHTPPHAGTEAIEIPQQIKRALGLDEERPWLVTTDINLFTWPGMDLRPIDRARPDRISYGHLPPAFLQQVKKEIARHVRDRSLRQVNRND